ncbi:RNA cytidine acetyltransferase [Trichonephila clavipes]|nr:RNA cytidine acetyltransferase [Trichonephila clavipes]
MPKTNVNKRISDLIINGINSRHRSLFFIYGEKSKEQVLYLHHLWIKNRLKVGLQNPSILWCYRKEKDFDEFYLRKRSKKLRKGYLIDNTFNKNQALDHLLLSSEMKFCHYSETNKVLGQTFGMLVLQDFDGLTPNIIARTTESVEGGGIILFLLPDIKNLAELFTLEMLAHSRYVTESRCKISPRFNKRFVLSLSSCQNCLVLDDTLEIKLLPLIEIGVPDNLEIREGVDFNVQKNRTGSVDLITGVEVFKKCYGCVFYTAAANFQKAENAGLVVIDEAAAIPLPLVKKWLDCRTVLMASTINGYEGTGRSLSLKLLKQLRNQSVEEAVNRHILHEIQLNEAIRYANGDAVEDWLNCLLCLDASIDPPYFNSGPPKCQECDLYYVNRDILFSYNKFAEKFLQQVVSLFVSSHYKNSPNDLLMLADAPAHHIFCLLSRQEVNANTIPNVFCVIQDRKGPVYYELLKQGKTINANLYCNQLDKLNESIKGKKPALASRKGIVFHHNARSHTAMVTQQKLNALGWEVLGHPPYSPDIAPVQISAKLSNGKKIPSLLKVFLRQLLTILTPKDENFYKIEINMLYLKDRNKF